MDDSAGTGAHSHANLGSISVDKIGMDTIEKVVLSVSRHLCQTFAAPYGQTWEIGAQFAENELGPAQGSLVFLRVVEFIRAIRHERAAPFSFIDARCTKCATQILPVELHLIMSTRYARQNDMQNFMAECTGLVGGGQSITACQNAGMRLAQVMENIQPIGHAAFSHAPMQSQLVH